MKNIINNIIAIRSRVTTKDALAIYSMALIDVALLTLVIAAIAYFA